nr:hypothetical protein [Desulfobacterales bacterium]
LSFRICDKKIWYNFEFTQKSLSVMVEAKGKPDVHITVNGKQVTLQAGKKKTIKIRK